mmetsp:Transcript_7404/g.29771  ORF Transcript_7404/g.29771 Transcript_7404/m.29771 type:complete len:81 (+) Transcript_7404:1120-1362(+)
MLSDANAREFARNEQQNAPMTALRRVVVVPEVLGTSSVGALNRRVWFCPRSGRASARTQREDDAMIGVTLYEARMARGTS